MFRAICISVVGLAILSCLYSRKGHSQENSSVPNKEATWTEIKKVIQADTTDEKRLAVLERIIDVGMSEKEINKLLGGPWASFGHGPGFAIANYGDIKLGLVVHFYPDGEAYAIGYCKNGHEIILRSDDPITWPKTKNERYEQLRRKKTRS